MRYDRVSHRRVSIILTDVLGLILEQVIQLLVQVRLLIGDLNIVLQITVIGQQGEETVAADVQLDI